MKEKRVYELFLEAVSFNARKSASLTNPQTGLYLELDLWIPSLQIGFEFQDPYHYSNSVNDHFSSESVVANDKTKEGIVRLRGDTLVVVPCWWDGQINSLANSIIFHRPDLSLLLSPSSSDSPSPSSFVTAPIPLCPSHELAISFIPNVGVLMLASFPPVAFLASSSTESYWWLGEKYDGIRFCWHPGHKAFHLTYANYSRLGSQLLLPPSFYKHMKNLFLDGEFWFGRGNFREASKLVISTSDDSHKWATFRAIAFDVVLPEVEIEDRYRQILRAFSLNDPFSEIPARLRIEQGKSREKTVWRLTEHVTKSGGEGSILILSSSLYLSGRSTSLFKLKTSRGDSEALVVGIKNGYITAKLPDDTEFQMSLRNEDTNGDTQIIKGDVITFSYEHINLGIPQNAKLIRIRDDITWKDVLQSYSKDLNINSLQAIRATSAPRYKGKRKSIEIGRRILDQFARSLKLDPLIASTWYSLSTKQASSDLGVRNLIQSFNNSYIKTVTAYFPELQLEPDKFLNRPRYYYSGSIDACRALFIDYAQKKGFDALVASNWYTQSRKDLESVRSMGAVLQKYQTLRNAVSVLFPEIGAEKSQFRKHLYWSDIVNRRDFLDRYARLNGFDPLIPSNWYSVRKFQLDKMQVTSAALKEWGDYKKFILATYPDIGLDISQFDHQTRYHWHNAQNRRDYLENIAKANGMDPLVPNCWYNFPLLSFRHKTKFNSILTQYPGHDYRKAIIHLFPELNLDLNLFKTGNI